MLSDLIKMLKECGLHKISVAALIAIIIGLGVLGVAGDKRYMLKEEGAEIQQYNKAKLKIDIMVLDMKASGASEEQINAAIKAEYERLLGEMKGK